MVASKQQNKLLLLRTQRLISQPLWRVDGENSNSTSHRRQEVHQSVKNACDELNIAGVDVRNCVEQLARLFFFKLFSERRAVCDV